MHIFCDIENLSDDARGATLVLGSFDGVHRGHAALVAAARVRPYAVGVLTFSPHPRLLLQPEQTHFLLTPGKEKYVALTALDVDFCVELPFTRKFASISAKDFVSEILVERLAASHLTFGENFRFGAGRKGDAALLQRLGAKYGFTVDRVAPVLDESGQAYSSTRVRDCLRSGDVAGARAILGRPWAIKASVLEGPADGSRAVHFHFGAHLKPLPGHYNVRWQYDGGRPAEAHLIVAQNDDVGRLEVGQDVDLRRVDVVTLELLDFMGPLTTTCLRGESRAANVRYF